MKLLSLAAGAALSLVTALGQPALAADLTRDEADAIAVDAYLYFYPLVTMDLTRRQLVSLPEGAGAFGGGAMNLIDNIPTYPTAADRTVVRPNFDTLYSSAFIDLTGGPMVLSVPDTGGRYYLMPFLDMWTDTFAAPGWRTTGTDAQNFILVPPDWRPDLKGKLVETYGLPENSTVIGAPTRHLWLIGRTKTDGPQDYDAVHKIQAGYKLMPLEKWGQPYEAPKHDPIPGTDIATPPKIQIKKMDGETFFTAAAELMKTEPPHITDVSMLERMKRLGIVEGDSFDFDKADPVVQAALNAAPETALKLIAWKAPRVSTVVNGWSMDTESVGVFGNNYLKRAVVADIGLGINQPQDAVYPISVSDADGDALDAGKHDYVLHFEKDQIPPVDAFWSVTVYDNDGFQVANDLNRFALSSWMDLKTNADGSLDLYFQNESPGPDRQDNWLPTPKGPFNVTMRLYAPHRTVTTGQWAPPAIAKAAN
ncbi:DUF1254 domain-containing protein [Chachezhania sediminis]|uniref:DUF1254 domain-containing protein n=1 Tax=Chachezhania sediminis TaxID=2599291 RepID=UPI00131BD5FE|nr:DUF1254 domain-containing protein [Chachezhania sediminis]